MKKAKILAAALAMTLCVGPALSGGLQAAADEPFDVVAVGVLDTNPQGSYVDFGSSYLWQVKCNKNLYAGPESDAQGDKLKTFVQAEYGDYIAINGKTVTQWNAESFNSVMIHIGINDAIGQYFEFNTNSLLDGLLSGDRDNTVTFLKGLPAGDGSTLQENVTFTLAKGSKEPFVRADKAEEITPPEPTEPVDPSTIPFDVAAVGVLDQSPQKGLHDFGSSFLWQIDFTKDFYNESQLTNGRKDHVQSELGDYIIINGKSVTQWNEETFNSVMIHVATNPSFGQYLEMNTNSLLNGLVDPSTDNVVTILEGFPCAGGGTLEESVSYSLPANSTAPFVRLDEPVLPETPPTEEAPESSATTTTTGGFVIVDEDESGGSEISSQAGSDAGGLSTGLIVLIVVIAVVVIGGGAAVLVLWKKGILFKKK